MPCSKAARATGSPPFVPAPWWTAHFPSELSISHADCDARLRRLKFRDRVERVDRIAHSRTRFQLGAERLVHHASPDLIAWVVDAHQADPDQTRDRRESVVILRVGSSLSVLLHLPDRGIGDGLRHSMAGAASP